MRKILVLALVLLLAGKGCFEEITKMDTTQASTVTEMKNLLKMESILIDNMEKYADALQRKIDIISKSAKKMEGENILASLDAEKYFGNPLNSFSLLRRLQADWKAWHKYLMKPVGEVFTKAMKELIQSGAFKTPKEFSLHFDDKSSKLNDVKVGGAAVFPAYNLSIKPRKGAALIWQNFHPNNDTVNLKTTEISCPAVVGSKSVLNAWIREKKCDGNNN